MATSKTPFPISGTLGQFVFFHQDGKQFIRTRPEFNKKKWAKITCGPRRAAEAFGGAQICASQIYKSLKPHFKAGGLMPYAHNHIAGKLRRQAYFPNETTEAYTSRHITDALHRLDIGAGKQTAQTIRTSLLGPNHDPHTVLIKGIQEAAQAIDPSGQLNLQYQIKVFHVAIQPISINQETRKWHSTSQVPTKAPLLIEEPRSTYWQSVFPKNPQYSNPLATDSLSPDNHQDSHSHARSQNSLSPETLRIPLHLTSTAAQVVQPSKSGPGYIEKETVSYPTAEGGRLTFISIQFRTASRSRRPAVLHEHTLMRCISIHMTEEKATDHAIHNTTPRRHFRPQRSCRPATRSRTTTNSPWPLATGRQNAGFQPAKAKTQWLQPHLE